MVFPFKMLLENLLVFVRDTEIFSAPPIPGLKNFFCFLFGFFPFFGELLFLDSVYEERLSSNLSSSPESDDIELTLLLEIF